MSLQDNGNLPALCAENTGVSTYRLSTNAASLCADIVKATAVSIQGRKYVRVEGWQSIALAHGCIVSARDVERIEDGLRAIGEVRRMSDGALLATAEGFLGDDEPTWQKRPMFARRAMVQTRAMSRACRTAFAHVVVMIDKNLSTTPAEEMQGMEDSRSGSGWAGSNGHVDPQDHELTDRAPRFTAGQVTRIKKWLEGAHGTLRLTAQTPETIGRFRRENASKFDWVEANMPEEHEKIEKTYRDALDAAHARMPAPETNTLMAG